jgi:hypothetical protein
MTSSLTLQTYKETAKVSLDNFKTEVMKLLSRLAPEYIDLIERHEDYMLPALRGILEYWSSQLSADPTTKGKFLGTKMVECLAFWHGYFTTGGRNRFLSIEKSLPSSDTYQPSSNHQIFVVIPVGSTNARIRQIMNATLSALHQSSAIVRVYCVYDGVVPIPNFEVPFAKVQNLLIPKRKGPATARNLGMHSGFQDGFSDVLLLDSDILVTAQQVDQLLREYGESYSTIGCPLVFAAGETWFDYYHDVSGTLNGRYQCASQGKDLLFGTTSCMLVSRNVYDSGISFSSDFAEAAGEDIDFCLQALFAGFSITALDNVAVLHKYGYDGDDSYNWRNFRSRYERYGRGEVRILQKHPYYCDLFNRSQERTCYARKIPN